MFAKISVKGDDQDKLYTFLTSKETNPDYAGAIKWNFTKFLVDRSGKVVARFEPKVKPDDPEVIAAIEGRYAASARERISDEPKPPFGDLRRRGGVRVFTALPIWHGDRVIGVVTASRTGLDAVSSLWQNRRWKSRP
jgi:hypothetical protein